MCREEWIKELESIEQDYRNILKQKSRIKWAVDGDENSNFFLTYVKNKFKKQTINGVNWNGEWIENPNMLKK